MCVCVCVCVFDVQYALKQKPSSCKLDLFNYRITRRFTSLNYHYHKNLIRLQAWLYEPLSVLYGEKGVLN